MVAVMGTFNIELTVGNLRDPSRSRRVSVMVDTGATYTRLPRDIVEDLGCRPIGSRQVVLADGREEEWPIATVRVTVEGQKAPRLLDRSSRRPRVARGGHPRGVRARRRSRRQASRACSQLP